MNKEAPKPPTVQSSHSETPPLSRAIRKAADAVLSAATFKPTVDGRRLVRQYEVHGIVVTEWVDVHKVYAST